VVEAKSSFRPYRPALGIDAALDEIRQHRGTLYDSDAVDICIDLFTNQKFAFDYTLGGSGTIFCVASPQTLQSSMALAPKR
jgi:putative two-component system response regulator